MNLLTLESFVEKTSDMHCRILPYLCCVGIFCMYDKTSPNKHVECSFSVMKIYRYVYYIINMIIWKKCKTLYDE